MQNVAFGPTITVTETSPNGQPLSSDNSSIVTLNIAIAGGGGSTLTAPVVNGVAQFPYTPTVAGAYTFTATESNYLQGQMAFSVETSTTHLVFATQPGTTVAGDAVADPQSQVIVYVEDQFGDKITNDTVTLSVFPFSAFVTGQYFVPAVNGVATFGTSNFDSTFLGLNSNIISSQYWLIASDSTNSAAIPATSQPFIVTPGPAHNLVLSSSTVTIGTSFDLSVQAVDIYGDLATEASGDQLTLSVASDPAGATIQGTTTATLQDGVATFDDLSLDTNVAGTYSLFVADPSDRPRSEVKPAGRHHYARRTHPVGLHSTTQGNSHRLPHCAGDYRRHRRPVREYRHLRQFQRRHTRHRHQPRRRRALDGVITATAVNGLATFENASVDTVGAYTLAASDDGADTATTSASFTAIAPATIFVDQNATSGANNGLDWPDAFTTLQTRPGGRSGRRHHRCRTRRRFPRKRSHRHVPTGR